MTSITDEEMNALLRTAKSYSVVILKPGPRRHQEGAEKIIWEHGRRNFSLRADGVLSIVCPIRSEDVAGLYIFDLGTEETVRIMRDDPGFQAGVFSFDVYPCRGFPGNSLPG